jgi:hypothetical protein
VPCSPLKSGAASPRTCSCPRDLDAKMGNSPDARNALKGRDAGRRLNASGALAPDHHVGLIHDASAPCGGPQPLRCAALLLARAFEPSNAGNCDFSRYDARRPDFPPELERGFRAWCTFAVCAGPARFTSRSQRVPPPHSRRARLDPVIARVTWRSRFCKRKV